MAKINGKDLEFWFDSKEYPVESISLQTQFDEEETTDTSTPGDGKDFDLIRASRGFNVEAFLYEPDGNEISSGTLTKGKRYRVTAKDSVLDDYEVGQIFEADGTETMSSTDKAVPLGNKIKGLTMDFSFDGSDVKLTDANYNVQYDEKDVTDDSTTGDAKETEVTRAERGTEITGWSQDADADLLSASPASKAGILKFSTSVKVEGNCIPTQKSIEAHVEEFTKATYTLRWLGLPTETALGLAAATEKAFKIILKRGTSTNKEYTGNCIVTAKQVSITHNSMGKITYTLSVNGAQTENEAADA